MALSQFSTYNLVLQLVILALLGLAVYQMRYKHNFRAHGVLVTTAVVLSLTSILLVMVPSLLTVTPAPGLPGGWMYTYVLVHHVIGLVALGLSLFMVSSWLLRGAKPSSCPGRPENKKLLMRTTLGIWTLSIVLGIILYLIYL